MNQYCLEVFSQHMFQEHIAARKVGLMDYNSGIFYSKRKSRHILIIRDSRLPQDFSAISHPIKNFPYVESRTRFLSFPFYHVGENYFAGAMTTGKISDFIEKHWKNDGFRDIRKESFLVTWHRRSGFTKRENLRPEVVSPRFLSCITKLC